MGNGSPIGRDDGSATGRRRIGNRFRWGRGGGNGTWDGQLLDSGSTVVFELLADQLRDFCALRWGQGAAPN